VGINFCEESKKQELLDVWSLIDASLNYRYLLIAGEVPPPLAVEETVLEKRNGYSVVKREVRFYPPAYFPVDRISYLRDGLILEKPIRETGTYEVKIHLFKDIDATVTVDVVPLKK
jgi:hypothetical protein